MNLSLRTYHLSLIPERQNIAEIGYKWQVINAKFDSFPEL